MNHFQYKDGMLCAESVRLDQLAEKVGTPFYCYSTATLERHYKVFAGAVPAGSLVAYAAKANDNLAVLKTLGRLGAGCDVVSLGEMAKALAAGIAASKIVFSGVGKTAEEMRAALEAGIYQFNIESEPELGALNTVALAMGKRAPVALRINPDVDAKTHAKINTGTAETKFGIPFAHARKAYALAATLQGIEVVGVDVHIGSQITDLAPFETAFTRIGELIAQLRADGHAITRLDLGGGLGVPYENSNRPPPDPAAYGAMVTRVTKDLDCTLSFEPGRLIAANAGVLVSRVIYVKRGEAKTFLIIDAAMNDLVRPAMYDAHHDIAAVTEPAVGSPRLTYDVVGPICETSDLFAADRPLPALKSGDLVAILSAGAYGAVMASDYNARPTAPEVLVSGEQWGIVRPRESYADLIAKNRIPDWLAD
ncbi:MAG TPA: diaminopimelate decarboxylase [Rhizomicrobium sp.]|nr:diaminopimelate decarboxylase [Rhizomicrobium sp.]